MLSELLGALLVVSLSPSRQLWTVQPSKKQWKTRKRRVNKKSVVAKNVPTPCTTTQIEPPTTEVCLAVTPLQFVHTNHLGLATLVHLKQMLFPLPRQAWSHLKASCRHPPAVIAQICCSVLMSLMKVESKDLVQEWATKQGMVKRNGHQWWEGEGREEDMSVEAPKVIVMEAKWMYLAQGWWGTRCVMKHLDLLFSAEEPEKPIAARNRSKSNT